jgi:hypothetical protein
MRRTRCPAAQRWRCAPIKRHVCLALEIFDLVDQMENFNLVDQTRRWNSSFLLTKHDAPSYSGQGEASLTIAPSFASFGATPSIQDVAPNAATT